MNASIRVFCGLVAAAAVAFGLFYRTEADVKTRSDGIWLLSLLVTGIALLGVFWVGRGPFKTKRGLEPEERLRLNVQRVSSVIIVGFLLISLQLLRQSVVVADELEKPYQGTNSKGQAVTVQDPRKLDESFIVQRGRIFDGAGKEVAGTAVAPSGLVRRTYNATSPLKQLLGYYSPGRYGNSGLEENYDEYLSGRNTGNPFLTLQRSLLNQPTVGNDLYLTIDPNLQQVAQNTLGQTSGSIVLLDAKTGAVLAMVGYPRYDPAVLAFDPALRGAERDRQNAEIERQWKALNSDPTSPLLTRPTQGLYTPGSIFKTITLAGMLDAGKTTPEAKWSDPGFFIVDSFRVVDNNRPNNRLNEWTTREGYMFSLNAVFAQMGLQLGADGLQNYSEKFGFEKTVPFDLPTSKNELTTNPDFLKSRTAQAETAFGQGQLLISPLHAALAAAAMGRGDGVIPKPYLVQQIKNRTGTVVKETQPNETWIQAVRPETASVVRDIMIASATDGWVGQSLRGTPVTRQGAVLGGKTGTAEIGNGINNAWYIGWASKGDRLFAVAVVIDRRPGGEGLADAMPRANQVLVAALAGVK